MLTNFFRATPFAPLFVQAGLAAIDVGSRGGFDPDLLPAAWAVDGIGFEPEPEAFAVLRELPATPWRSMRWLPAAVSGHSGPAVLHVPPDPNGASLLEHDPEIGRRFGISHLTDIGHTVAVETLSLADAAECYQLPSAAYLKLDVEGAELAILAGAGKALDSVLAIKLEASFIPTRRNQPLAADLEQWLRGQGFILMDILTPAHWRRGTVAPHPYLRAADPAYSRGQIAQCDLLFFRAPDALADGEAVVRAGLLAMAFGFFDHAAMLFERPEAARLLDERWRLADPAAALADSSRRFGRCVCRQAIRRRLRDLVPLVRSLVLGLPD